VALARDGHAPAFEVIVRRYRKELLAYCRRLQPRWGSAEDALQQTLLQAWRALTSGSEVREVRPWLYRIAHNVVVSDLRSPIAAPQELEAPALGPEVDQLVEQRIRARAALDAMASLPALQRQALVSTTFDGASRAEVAAALGLSRGAVRGLVYRARETLRAAAAAITPSPALSWAIRRAEAASGSSRATVEALAGGGGAGVAGLLVKGSAVITLAGAVAGTGSALLPSHVHHHVHARTAAAHHAGVLELAAEGRGQGPASARALRPPGSSAGRPAFGEERRNGPGARGRDGGSSSASGSGDRRDRQGSSGGQDGGSPSGERGPSGGSDGGSTSGAGVASSSGSSDGRRGTSGGDGGSGGSTTSGDSTTASSSGDGGGSGSGTDGSNSTSTTTSGGQMMGTLTTSSDGGSGSGGGTSGGSGDLGSGDTTTTTSGGH
jgi:RNA polymerase sigma factor (sigma-70 family)